MRILTCFLLAAVGTVAGAAETWRWVDSNGVTHYSDRPVPGATRVQLQSAPRPGGSAATPATGTRPAASSPAVEREQPFRYTGCMVSSPQQDQVFNNADFVPATIDVLPELRRGDRVVVFLDGRPAPGWPDGVTSYVFSELQRGSYTLSARVLDESGEVMCTGGGVTFHVRRQSLLNPSAPGGSTPRPGTVPTVPGVPSVPRVPAPR